MTPGTSEAIDRVLVRFTNAWGEPKSENPVGLLAEWKLALSSWHAAVIEKAASEIIASWGGYAWPKIGAVTKLCREYAPKLSPQPEPEAPPLREERYYPTEEERRHCDELVRQLKATVAERSLRVFGPPAKPVKCDRDVFERRQRERAELAAHQEAQAAWHTEDTHESAN